MEQVNINRDSNNNILSHPRDKSKWGFTMKQNLQEIQVGSFVFQIHRDIMKLSHSKIISLETRPFHALESPCISCNPCSRPNRLESSWKAAVMTACRLQGPSSRTVSSQFWKLEAQDSGVSRVSVFCGFCPWLIVGQLLPEPSQELPTVPVSVAKCPLLTSRDTSQIGLGPTLITSF